MRLKGKFTINKNDHDIIDDDLFEDIDDEEMERLVEEAREDALERARQKKLEKERKTKFPKWVFWLIALAMVINVISILPPQTISIPALDFLVTSAKLSTDKEIKTYKEAVVVVETGDSRGTGFSISSDGTIITNEHVVKDNDVVTVGFAKDGLFSAEVVETHPSVDLAVLQVEGEDLPFLQLADTFELEVDEQVTFIGNPLSFQRIVNKGTIIGYTTVKDWTESVVMIEAPIYRGNSGSPIINDEGEVIGVVFATTNRSEHGKVGLFVPIDYFYQYKSGFKSSTEGMNFVYNK